MNKDNIINSIKAAIIETYTQFVIIESDIKEIQQLVATLPDHPNHIFPFETFTNATKYFDYDSIESQLKNVCDFETVIDHWQQYALDELDDSDITEDEFDNLYNNNGFKPLYKEAFLRLLIDVNRLTA